MTTDVLNSFEIPTARTLFTRGAVARTLVHQIVAGMPIRMRYPDGALIGGGGEGAPTLDLIRPTALWRRLEQHPKIGLGESYMAGDWRAAEGTDLAQALLPFAARMGRLLPKPLLRMRGIVDRAMPVGTRNTPTGSRANIEAHYDLSNDLFAAFLDPTMSYSSALFDEATPFAEQSLVEAQHRKIDTILDSAGGRPGLTGSRDRDRLGRAVPARSVPGGRGPLDHALPRAAGAGPRADRGSRAQHLGRGAAAGLPRGLA